MNKTSFLPEKIIDYSTLQGFQTASYETVEILENGNQIFESMLNSIENANKFILLETFIFWNGEIAKMFTRLLCKKSKEGIDCKIILDAYGCKKIDKNLVEELRKCSVRVFFIIHLVLNIFFQTEVSTKEHTEKYWS